MRPSMFAAVCLAAGALGWGCGESSTLPEPPPCGSPSATPTVPSAPSGTGSGFRYTRTVQDGVNRLSKSLAEFRTAYPDRRLYRTSQFRNDYVNYAGQAACTVKALSDLSLAANVPTRFRDFDVVFKAVLADYGTELVKGREAVAQRNTSKYHDWWDSMDALDARMAEALKSVN